MNAEGDFTGGKGFYMNHRIVQYKRADNIIKRIENNINEIIFLRYCNRFYLSFAERDGLTQMTIYQNTGRCTDH